MKSHKTTAVLLLSTLVLALIPNSGRAQRLYNKERDEQAQAALPLAQDLKTGELFDRQLRNLAALGKKNFETEFLLTRLHIDAFSVSLLTWNDAHQQVCAIEKINAPGNLPTAAEVANEVKAVEKSIADAQESLKAFKKSIKTNEEQSDGEDKERSVLATLFGGLGDFEEITNFAAELSAVNSKLITPETIDALKEVQEIAAVLKNVYDEYRAKVDEFNQLNEQLAELRIILKKVAIQSLQVDEEHLKNIAAIITRHEAERADVLGRISEYKGIVGRLRLVQFNEKATPPVLFCSAVADAVDEDKGLLDPRPHQLITDHLRDLTARAQSMAKDNRQVEIEATNAIKGMAAASTEEQRRAAAQQTFAALKSTRDNITVNEWSHSLEDGMLLRIRNAGDDLDAAIKKSTDSSIKALRAIVIMARTSSIDIRDMVADVPQALYVLAALVARGATPSKLADLRFNQELHAYSIRKSAVRARAYELTVSTGAQRLALFHKGGIKPTDIAELVFAASNVAITPAILAR